MRQYISREHRGIRESLEEKYPKTWGADKESQTTGSHVDGQGDGNQSSAVDESSFRVAILDRRNSEDRATVDLAAATNQSSTFYHTSNWWDAMELVFGYKTKYLLVGDVRSSYCLLPLANVGNDLIGRRLISLPMTQFCGPIYNDLQALRTALKCSINMRSRASQAIAIRGRQELPANGIEPFARQDYYVNYWLDFRGKSQTDLWKDLDRGKQKGIRKAEKLGIEVETALTNDGRNQLYQLMLRTTNRHGVPPYPRSLIDFVADNAGGSSTVHMAKFEGRIISAITHFNFGKTTLGGYSFALDEYFHTGSTSLLFWTAICESHGAGKDFFDLGIVSPHQQGLRQFKRYWGAKEALLPFYYFGGDFTRLVSDPNSSYRFAQVLWRHIPSRLQIMLAPPLLRAVG